MIDHDYKLTIRELPLKLTSDDNRFAATATQVYITVDGQRTPAHQYLQREFFGKTSNAALVKASIDVRQWLDSHRIVNAAD